LHEATEEKPELPVLIDAAVANYVVVTLDDPSADLSFRELARLCDDLFKPEPRLH
jgi:hypothetical protein